MALHKSALALISDLILYQVFHLFVLWGFLQVFTLVAPSHYVMSSYLILFQLCTYPLLFFTWFPCFIFFMALVNIQNHLTYFDLSPILEYKLYDSKDLVFLLLSSQCLRSNIYSMNQNQTQYIDYGNAKKSPSKFIILKDQKEIIFRLPTP